MPIYLVDEGIEEATGACAVEALLEVCVDGIMIWGSRSNLRGNVHEQG
jgi:hypothetical protein